MIVDAHMHVWNKIHGKISNEISVSPLSNGMIRVGRKAVLGMPPYMVDCARQSLDFVRHSDCFSERDKAFLLGKNACRLYRLPEVVSVRQPVRAITED